MAEVVLKNVKKVYISENTKKKDIAQIKPAVEDFTMTIKPGEFVVFVGPSGCGKSTTLRMIAGLEEITAGEIYIDGKYVNDCEPKDRDIAMVFQNYALYPHLTVHGNMSFGLKLNKALLPKVDRKGNSILDENGEIQLVKRHYTRKEIDEKVVETASILEINRYLNRKPKELSGGERQRVAIGRALVRKPKVFLMDEPLSNLDAKLRNQMRSEIILLHEKIKTTFIYVTHDQTEAMTLGDRIVVMKDGFIQQIGTPKDVFYSPANLFVAGFIGTPQMNFFEATLNKDYTIEVLGKKLELPPKTVARLKRNKELKEEIIIGARPEYIDIIPAKDSFVGKITVSEMMGSEYHVHCLIDSKKIIIRTPVKGNSDEVINLIEKNETIPFQFNLDEIHLFDKESGIAI
ncbi:MAG: ABC transporter ATP-binding protein [Bacilli bacterium]